MAYLQSYNVQKTMLKKRVKSKLILKKDKDS